MSSYQPIHKSSHPSKLWQILAGILVLVMLLSAAGCGASATTSTAAPAQPTDTAAAAPTDTAAAAAATDTPAAAMPAGRPAGGPGASGPATTATPKYADVAYASLSSAEKLDLYIPEGSGPFPVIINIHGGGFMMGDKAGGDATGTIDALLSAGYAVASINYRLSAEAKAPAQIQDVKAAVRFLRAKATEYHLNSDKFGVWGGSAGGSLSALLGTSCGVQALEGAELGNADQSSCVQAVVDWFGPIDFLQMDTQFTGTSCPANHNEANSPESQLVGAAIQDKPELSKAVNAITYITDKAPAFFIQHGTADCNVPPAQGQLLYDALKAVIGTDKVTLTFLEGAGHGGSEFTTAENLKLVINFLDKYLK